MDNKDIKIIFEPGCFDSFEGTQEELDALMVEIQQLISSGEIFENSEIVLDEEMPDWIADILESGEEESRKRKLN